MFEPPRHLSARQRAAETSCGRRSLALDEARRRKRRRRPLLELEERMAGGGRRYGPSAARHGWRRRWSISPSWPQAPTLPAMMRRALAEAYLAEGWKADWAAMRALDIARTGEDREAVTAALRAVYLPWLDAGAAALQKLAATARCRSRSPQAAGTADSEPLCCLSMGCAWIWRSGSRRCSRARARRSSVGCALVWLSDRDRDLQSRWRARRRALLAAASADGLIPCYRGQAGHRSRFC